MSCRGRQCLWAFVYELFLYSTLALVKYLKEACCSPDLVRFLWLRRCCPPRDCRGQRWLGSCRGLDSCSAYNRKKKLADLVGMTPAGFTMWRNKRVTVKAAEEQKSHNHTGMIFGSLSLLRCFIVAGKTELHVYLRVAIKSKERNRSLIKHAALPKD